MNEIYRSYLLRLWLEPNNPPVWRAMLENPVNGERRGFTDLEAMFGFIRSETQILSEHNPLSEAIEDENKNDKQ